jgi:hypothetical protein
VTAAIEKWKANYASHFPTAPAAENRYLKKKEKIDLLHSESESAHPNVRRRLVIVDH